MTRNYKKAVMKTIFALTVLCMVSGFTACTESNDNGYDMAVILGNHLYGYEANLSEIDEIQDCIASGGTVHVIVAEGEPSVIESYRINSRNKLDKQSMDKLSSDMIQEASDKKYIAQSENVDLITCLGCAARVLRGGDFNDKIIIIVDSGLSTDGCLDMSAHDYLNADPETVCGYLRDANALPDLSGMSVEWIGLGDVCGEQPYLDTKNINSLETLWESVINECGGSVSFVSSVKGNPLTDAGLPANKIVKIPNNEYGDVFKFSEADSKVTFIPDQAVFIDEKAAMTELSRISDKIKTDGGIWYIYGMTASYGPDSYCRPLSEDRANTVKKALVKLGVNEADLLCIGLGRDDNEWRVIDLDSDGNLIESEAQKNRAVIIIKKN